MNKSGAPATEKIAHRRVPRPSLRVIAFIIAAGALTGFQLFKPTKRVIEAIAGFILLLVMWNLSGFYALLFFIMAYPFPFALSLGNSDVIFILIIFTVSLIRTQAGLFKFRSSKKLNIPITLMVLSFFASFYNVDYAAGEFKINFVATFPFLTAVMLFYLCISYIDSEERMKKALNAVVISAAFVSLFTLFELLFPGRVLIQNWLYTQHRTALVAKGVRMQGPFFDYELLSEFFALNIPLIFLCLVRSKRLLGKAAYALLLFASLFLMFSTITRGGVIMLTVGFIYMAIISRRDLNFIRLVAFTAVLVFLMVSIDVFIARYTTSGSTLARLFASTFKSGIIPENRYAIWRRGIALGMETPFIGHGPAWDYTRGLQGRLIPHNIFLYLFDLLGLFGLSAFVFFLYRLAKMSVRSIGASLVSSPFPQALLKMLHVCLVMFILDQIKVEYLRNNIYTYFVWLLFGLIAAAYNIIQQNSREQVLPAPSP
jgi:O-antigen ligase